MGEGKKGARPGTRGTTNNPGGRPAEALMEREKWRKYGAEARKKAVNLMRHGSTEQIQLNAAKLIIERAWGASVQDVQIRSTSSPRAVVIIDQRQAAAQIDVQPATRVIDVSPGHAANGHAPALEHDLGADREGRAEDQ
jgi:hypothetical protein